MTKERALELVEELRAYEYRLGQIHDELAYNFPREVQTTRASAFVDIAQGAIFKTRSALFFDNDFSNEGKFPHAFEIDKETQR